MHLEKEGKSLGVTLVEEEGWAEVLAVISVRCVCFDFVSGMMDAVFNANLGVEEKNSTSFSSSGQII